MLRKAAAFLLIFMLAVTVGCGSGQQAAPADQGKGKKTIVVALPTFTGYGPLLVAKEKGLFEKNGLDVQLQIIDGLGERKQAILANKIQAMATALDVAVSLEGDGVATKIVWAFDSSNGADGIVVKNG